MREVIDDAVRYWQAPSDIIPDRLGLLGIMDDAYYALTLMQGSVVELGRSLVSIDAYVIPFELASVLLLAALVGAILVAWPRAEDQS